MITTIIDRLKYKVGQHKGSDSILRICNHRFWSVLLWLMALSSFVYAAVITIAYIDQPLADSYAFRQTQTALTSYWMIKEGWDLAYQTPVVGYPWSIPFEFPIYQAIVALVSGALGMELGAAGRFVSFVFLALCVLPAAAIRKRLDLPVSVLLVFCALMFTSPYMVYWGRTFMIETTAFFFSFASIPFAIDIIRGKGGWKTVFFYLVLASAGILQKSTTGGPVQLFLLGACLIYAVRQRGWNLQVLWHAIKPAVIICIPVAIGYAWAVYADLVKEANAFGAQLTSKALFHWNFGTISQRLSLDTWHMLLWARTIVPNAGGYVGLALLLLVWFRPAARRNLAWVTWGAVIMFLLPMMIFTNLHYVHEYYQVASIPYLIAALSIIIGGWIYKVSRLYAPVPVLTGIIIFLNISSFNSSYGIVAARELDELDPRSVKAYRIGRYLREHTQPGQGLVVFGQSYSSELTYQAQRKSMTADTWFKEYSQVWEKPEKYMGGLEIGAIVVCPSSTGFPGEREVGEKLASSSGWRTEKIEDCTLLLRDTHAV